MSDGHEQVGTVAEEAAKLLAALQGWADTGAGQQEQQQEGPEQAQHEHAGPDCRWCPVCRVAAVVRQTSPEVRDHLVQAASSLLQAGAVFLEARAAEADRAAGSRDEGGVERIDLDDDLDDDLEGDGEDPGAGWFAD